MSMKKIIASVAAAALTVGSLAVVGVSAEDDVKTFDFVYDKGAMKVNYSQTVNIRGGMDVLTLFKVTDANPVEYNFDYNLSMGVDQSNYTTKNLQALNEQIFGVTYNLKADGTPDTAPWGGWWVASQKTTAQNSLITAAATTITVTGTSITGNGSLVTAKATAKTDYAGHAGEQHFRVRHAGEPDQNVVLEGYDLDLSNIKNVLSITLSTTFDIDTQEFSVPAGVGGVVVADNLASQLTALGKNDAFTNYWNGYTSSTAKTTGKAIKVGTAYDFNAPEGTDNSLYPISYDASGNPIYADGFGYNTLRWINDNIVQQKGAKLRINFMTVSKLNDAIGKGDIFWYPTLEDNTWQGSSVLTPGSSSSTTTVANDMVMGVNLHNTTKLQQTQNIQGTDTDSPYVEFDWDEMVQNSLSTISGNVDSIAFRIVKTNNTAKITNKDGQIGIANIQIILPDQATVPGGEDPARILTAGSADCFVKLIGTDKTIYGNGAVEVAVENNITNSSVSYAVKLMDANGAYVQPGGEVTLQLSIPNDFRGATLSSNQVKHTCNDGTVEQLEIQNFETYKTDNYIVVKTSKFSDFEFGFETTEAPAETTTEAPAETTTEAPVETTTEAPATEAPANNGNASAGANTDKNAPTGVVLAVVPAAVAAAAVVISKKRK